jgi:hypothetical protein
MLTCTFCYVTTEILVALLISLGEKGRKVNVKGTYIIEINKINNTNDNNNNKSMLSYSK